MLKYLLFILISLISSINLYSGTWKEAAEHPGEFLTTNLHMPFYAYGDSTIVYMGERVDETKHFRLFIRYSLDAGKNWQNIFVF